MSRSTCSRRCAYVIVVLSAESNRSEETAMSEEQNLEQDAEQDEKDAEQDDQEAEKDEDKAHSA